ncbi:methylmalonate-semialdehyde dehydrogenase [acylating], mitochondrial-like isoform X2 [Chenopodium quinoa]|uniref:methylmalonate-semialdehyde dehydrogenase [acylating], mitochondrial-like isoform X2 n=1 Tax=Chenopodium quinoa TaxID=63459 RepID=UPI000B78694D|nr:methylmalonate-semialdehyde dehydrogenase [acylating], mitochondrial-like isoform X2 [Chenopodium quinoa]
MESVQPNVMCPPPPRTFKDREELITYVRDFGVSQGYVLTIRKSKRDINVVLGCDRGGGRRNRHKSEAPKRKRKENSRLINCPFEIIGKKEEDVWVLKIRNGEHNHEPLKDMSEHRFSRRFNEEEARQVKEMIEAGIKPRQVLETLKQSNPQLQSTPRHLYNLKTKIREGNFSERSFKSWRPNASSVGTSSDIVEQMKVSNLIGGKFVESQGVVFVDVINPATQEVVSQVPSTTFEEFKAAVFSAKEAFPLWKNTPVFTRQRIMMKLQELIHRDKEKLALIINTEQGKTTKSAHADILHWLEVLEHACEITTVQWGEFMANASNATDMYSIREPLGVCAGICNSNFSSMVPLRMFLVAVTCGNTFVLKPSEKNPGASMKLAALAIEAGFPNGVLNIVHGGNDIVNYVCDDDDIKSISCVGAYKDCMDIYAKATVRGKRVEVNSGSKNQAVVMPDACMDATLDALVASGFVAAGDPYMSLSSVIFVGNATPWEKELVKRAKTLTVSGGTDTGADVGPVLSKEVKDGICRSVQTAVESGARLILDGRDIMVPGYEGGNFVGPTILSDVTASMECFKEDIFGPVLLCTQVHSLEDAVAIINRHKFGNGASIFTTSGIAARKFQNIVEVGLIGINVPVPFPLTNSSAGSTESYAGNINFHGKAGIHFYTQVKIVAQQWRDLTSKGILSSKTLTSEEGASNQADLPVTVSSSSDTDSFSHEPSDSVPKSSREITDLNRPVNGPSIQNDLSCTATSMSFASTSGVNIPQTSTFTEVYPSTTQGLDNLAMDLSAERGNLSMESHRNNLDPQLLVTSESSYMSMVSHEMGLIYESERAYTAAATISEQMSVPTMSVKIEPTPRLSHMPAMPPRACVHPMVGDTSHETHDQAPSSVLRTIESVMIEPANQRLSYMPTMPQRACDLNPVVGDISHDQAPSSVLPSCERRNF